jgi:hypothetical protein
MVRVVGEGRMRKRRGLIISVVIDNRFFVLGKSGTDSPATLAA